ncbi:cytochrome P450 [Xylogone sp. PMI_703]|nr:cytochrome P450 [Xylogone sp. PMI_703]
MAYIDMEESIPIFTPAQFIFAGVIFVGLARVISRPKGEKNNIPLVAATWAEIILRKAQSPSSLILKGYNEYCLKRSRSFKTSSRRVVISPTLFAEAKKLPDDVLSAAEAFDDMLHLNHTLGREIHDVLYFVRKNISKALPSLLPEIQSEVNEALKDNFGSNLTKQDGQLQRNQIRLLPAAEAVISQTTCRILVGKSLSQNKEFTEQAVSLTHWLIFVTLVLDWVPSFLRGIVMWILPFNRRKRAFKEMLRESVMNCLSNIKNDQKKEHAQTECPILHDLVSKVVVDLDSRGGSSKLDIEKVLEITTARLIALMFAAFDTTSLTLAQVFLDIMAQDQTIYADAMRAEAISALAAENGKWTSRSLQNLKLVGSFLKESQRLHPIGISLGAKKVLKPGGWKFSNGDYVSFGDTVTVPAFPLQRDETIYPDANDFQGFRFVKDERAEAEDSVRDTFLAFGYGRHACPGKALALAMLKIVIAQFLIDYEYTPLAERPKDGNIGNYLVPPLRTTISVNTSMKQKGLNTA